MRTRELMERMRKKYFDSCNGSVQASFSGSQIKKSDNLCTTYLFSTQSKMGMNFVNRSIAMK